MVSFLLPLSQLPGSFWLAQASAGIKRAGSSRTCQPKASPGTWQEVRRLLPTGSPAQLLSWFFSLSCHSSQTPQFP